MANDRHIFKRKAYEKLLKWKNERNGSTALLIEGARRVGKSTIAKLFAENEYKSYIIIDFSTVSKEIKNLFEDISDLNYIFLRLQVYFGVELFKRNSVIIFDEVQLNPYARQAIKHLVADGRYDYIETGSLVSIKQNVKGIVIPSEETSIELHPLDFEEFMCAVSGSDSYTNLLKMSFDSNKPLGAAHRKLMRDIRLYMLVGGMPQAVAEYIDTNNLQKVDLVKRDIIRLYLNDFHKIDPSGRLSLLFESIPSQLNSNATRFKPGNIFNGNNNEYLELIADMKSSMTVNIAYHANDPNVGLALCKDVSKYKIFLEDTGLFITLAFKDKDFTENVIYQQLLSDKLSVNLGYVYENLVAQILRAKGDELFYYSFKSDTSRHYYEVDFILSRHNKICPLEVKSSNYKTHTSLDKFCRKFSSRIGSKYLISSKDYHKETDIICLPMYFVQFI